MNTFKNNFKINGELNSTSISLMLMDFVFVAVVSLLFNGLIINSKRADVDQLIFMTLAAVLFSAHYFSDAVFNQKFAKKTITFRVLTILKMITIGSMAVGLTVLVFRKNKNPDNHDFLKLSGHIIFISGLLVRRALSIFQYSMVYLANDDMLVKREGKFKIILRILSFVFGTIQLSLLATGFNINLIIYIFMPLHIIFALVGNVVFINGKTEENKNIQKSLMFYKDRYSRWNFLFISSFIVSGAIQFAWYYNEPGDQYMLLRIFFTFLIGALVFWSYVDRLYRFEIKETQLSVKLLNFLNIIIVVSLLWLGGLTINANNSKNMQFIVMGSSGAVSTYLLALALFSKLISKNQCRGGLARRYKHFFVFSLIPFIILFAVMSGVYSIIVPESNNLYVIHYSLLIPSLIIINIISRIVISTAKKNNMESCEI